MPLMMAEMVLAKASCWLLWKWAPMVLPGSRSMYFLARVSMSSRVEGPEGIDQVDDRHPAFVQVFQTLFQFAQPDGGDRHQIDGRLVAFVQAVMG